MTRPPLHLAALLLLLLLTSIFYGCKKTESPGDILCNGNGSGSLWPLAVGDAWFYNDGSSDFISASTGNEYVYKQGNYTDTLIVQANGDIYFKIQNYGNTVYQPYLLLPATYTLGQTWTSSVSPTLSITGSIGTSLSNIQGSRCNYENCLLVVIQTNSQGYQSSEAYAFKNGLGMVYYNSNNDSQATLDSVILR